MQSNAPQTPEEQLDAALKRICGNDPLQCVGPTLRRFLGDDKLLGTVAEAVAVDAFARLRRGFWIWIAVLSFLGAAVVGIATWLGMSTKSDLDERVNAATSNATKAASEAREAISRAEQAREEVRREARGSRQDIDQAKALASSATTNVLGVLGEVRGTLRDATEVRQQLKDAVATYDATRLRYSHAEITVAFNQGGPHDAVPTFQVDHKANPNPQVNADIEMSTMLKGDFGQPRCTVKVGKCFEVLNPAPIPFGKKILGAWLELGAVPNAPFAIAPANKYLGSLPPGAGIRLSVEDENTIKIHSFVDSSDKKGWIVARIHVLCLVDGERPRQ